MWSSRNDDWEKSVQGRCLGCILGQLKQQTLMHGWFTWKLESLNVLFPLHTSSVYWLEVLCEKPFLSRECSILLWKMHKIYLRCHINTLFSNFHFGGDFIVSRKWIIYIRYFWICSLNILFLSQFCAFPTQSTYLKYTQLNLLFMLLHRGLQS